MKEEQERRNKRLSESRKVVTFNKGDFVWMHFDQREGFKKLYHAWKGPCKIIRKYSNNVYSVEIISTGAIHQKVSVRRLRPLKAVIPKEIVPPTLPNNLQFNDFGGIPLNNEINDNTDEVNQNENEQVPVLNEIQDQQNQILPVQEHPDNQRPQEQQIPENQIPEDRHLTDFIQNAKGISAMKGSALTVARNFKDYCNNTLVSLKRTDGIVEELKNSVDINNRITIMNKSMDDPEIRRDIMDSLK
jgi:hypothetical protein